MTGLVEGAQAARPVVGGSPFPPIADYGFLSDCEVSALVAPSGNVEWLCLPRMDGPSVFAAMLDRGAGWFRLGPAEVMVPSRRRYLPGTMVLETTWGTPTGWAVFCDVLLVGPWRHGSARSETHQRAPVDHSAERVLLRTARCLQGTVDFALECEPAFDYRYTWLRDSTFMLWGLYTLGLDREANDFFYLITDLAEQDADLQIMYGIGGERELTEHTLDHLSGYDGARPVRIGNGAWDQRQHDVCGVLLDSVYLHTRSRDRLDERRWPMLVVSALTEIGEVARARALCEKLLSYASPLLLYAEEIDPHSGRHLGNFPQAFSHLALINAIIHLIHADEMDQSSSGGAIIAGEEHEGSLSVSGIPRSQGHRAEGAGDLPA